MTLCNEASGKRQHVSCICGADNSEFLGDKNGFRLVACAKCGMVYVDPQPDNEELQNFYSSQYWHQHQVNLGLKSIEDRLLDGREKAYFVDVLHWLTSRVSLGTGMRLLEIGCSHGIFCELISKLKVEVVGVEMDEQIANLTEKRTGLTIHSGGLASQNFGEAEFDIIATFDVIEHFTDPNTELGRISHSLKSGGWLYLSTPCRDAPDAQNNILAWGENKPPEHLFLFSFNDLQTILLQHGFYVWDARGIYSSRMFILARKGIPPKIPYTKPSLWRWKFRDFFRTLERKLRYSVRRLTGRHARH